MPGVGHLLGPAGDSMVHVYANQKWKCAHTLFILLHIWPELNECFKNGIIARGLTMHEKKTLCMKLFVLLWSNPVMY